MGTDAPAAAEMIFNKEENFGVLLRRIRNLIDKTGSRDKKLKEICRLLGDNVPYYDWVGFYLVDQTTKDMLILGPFAGEPIAHIKIPFGRGICGQAAERKATFVIQDVTKETNYLACSTEVSAEIVAPILKEENVVGELDVDSRQLSSFGAEDKQFLEAVCKELSKIF